MRRNKLFVYAGTFVLAAALLTGCGDSQAETGTESQVAKELSDSGQKTEDTQIVKVTALDGNTVTADIGELSENQGGQNGQVPEKPEDNGNGEAPEPPNGENSNGEMPAKLEDSGNGEAPEPPSGENSNGEVPAKPEDSGNGEAPEPPSGGNSNGDISAKPDGNGAPGNAPAGMGGNTFTANGESLTFTLTEMTQITLEYLQGSGEGTLEDIAVGAVLEITIDDNNNAATVVVRNLNANGGFGGSDTVSNGTAASVIDEDSSEAERIVDGATYTSDGDDENALRVDGVAADLEGITIEKTGGKSSNTENGDFYGANAGLLALNGATLNIKNAAIDTSAVNGNGVFSYGEGTTVNISDSTIRTTENNSGGIQTTGGGTMNAENLDVETKGNSAAAIRSDRGGGVVMVNGGNYVTNGTGSPAVYCTADITVKNAALTSNASEGVVVEGKNSVYFENCDIISSMENTYNGDSTENIHGIMIYQSMSGDADVGEASFLAKGGSITATKGDFFYVTNTDCTIGLENVELLLANDTFLRVEGNSSSRGWGTEGANGGDVVLSAVNQKIEGNILVDAISSLGMTLSEGSEFYGAVNPDGEGGEVTVTLLDDAVWTLTGDSYVTGFDGNTANVTSNGYHLYVNGEQVL
ncbi:MAG: hypothetical protein K2L07_14305 [Lachnospiraceae bacterium]|nr:hypothetical protein [Lachnospiraceae bacterium]